MANRVIPVEVKVEVMEESLRLVDVEAVAQRYGVSSGAIYYWFNHKLKPVLGEILANETPGPKPQPNLVEPSTPELDERPSACDRCGGTRIWKNGTYEVINWIWLLTVGWLVGLQSILIQRWRCATCGYELTSPEQQRQAEARQAWWQQVCRLIGLGRFKLGLSVRQTQLLLAFQYGRTVSLASSSGRRNGWGSKRRACWRA